MTINEKIFTHDDKLSLVTKINKIKKKKYLLNILNMIIVDNNVYNINSNGLFIFFHNLSNPVYNKIEKYVDNIYKKYAQKKISNATKEYTKNEKFISDYEFMSEFNNDMYASLSNKEKMIIKKRNYDEYIHNKNNKN